MNLHHNLSIYLFGDIRSTKEVYEEVISKIPSNHNINVQVYDYCMNMGGRWIGKCLLNQSKLRDDKLYLTKSLFVKMQPKILEITRKARKLIQEYDIVYQDDNFTFYKVSYYSRTPNLYYLTRPHYKTQQQLYGNKTLTKEETLNVLDHYAKQTFFPVKNGYIGSYKDKYWTGINQTLSRVQSSAKTILKNRVYKGLRK